MRRDSNASKLCFSHYPFPRAWRDCQARCDLQGCAVFQSNTYLFCCKWNIFRMSSGSKKLEMATMIRMEGYTNWPNPVGIDHNNNIFGSFWGEKRNGANKFSAVLKEKHYKFGGGLNFGMHHGPWCTWSICCIKIWWWSMWECAQIPL